MLGVSGFVGGDETLCVGRKGIEPTSDESETLGEEVYRDPLFSHRALLKPLRLPGVVVHETAEHELSLISSTPEELPSTPVSSRFSNKSHESSTIGSSEKSRLDNIRPGTSMGSEKNEHLGKSGPTRRSAGIDTPLTGIEPINSEDDGLNFESNRLALTRPAQSNRDTDISPVDEISENVPSSDPESDPPTAIQPAVKGDASSSITQSTSDQLSLGLPAQNKNSSEPYSSESAHIGPSTMSRSNPLVADTKESGQLAPSSDSRSRSRKAVTQDCNNEAPEADVPETVETYPETGSLSFGDDLYQGDIPNCVREYRENIGRGDSSGGPSRAFSSGMSQAVAPNDKQLKLHQSSDVNIEQPRGEPEDMRISAEVGQTARESKGDIEKLKERPRKTTEAREADYAMVNKLNHDHKEEIFQQRRQALASQEELFEYYERRYKKHLEEAREKDRTVAHLRQAWEIQQKGLVKYLQTELEEMVNITPVDHCSARIIGRVKELMQVNDEMGKRGEEMMGQVGILEGEKEAIERTATEAEEKAKKLSEEHRALEENLIRTETRISQLIIEKDELSQKNNDLEGNIIATETRISQLIFEKDELCKKNNDLEGRVKALEGEKSSLQQLVNDTKSLNETLKTQDSEDKKRARSIEEEMLGLRCQLTEEHEHASAIKTETLCLRQQIAELQETSTVLENYKKDLETRVKLIPTLEQDISLLDSKLADLEVARNEKARKDLEAHSSQVQSVEKDLQESKDAIMYFNRELLNTRLACSKLKRENESLAKTVREAKAFRIRSAKLLHDATKSGGDEEWADKLAAEVKELGSKLGAEKRRRDEKIAQVILKLRSE